jgi:hypothetical protein
VLFFYKTTKSYKYKKRKKSHEHTGMERMKELISSFSGSTCFEGAVLGKGGVEAAITREEHVTTRWP